MLHGAQLWVALPEASRNAAPFFERFVPQPFEFEGARVSVFLGDLLGHHSTARTFTRIVGAQLDLPANSVIALPVDSGFEHGILVDAGALAIDGEPVARDEIGYLPTGAESLTLATGDEPTRVLLIGGEPLGEQIVMWWNFIGRDARRDRRVPSPPGRRKSSRTGTRADSSDACAATTEARCPRRNCPTCGSNRGSSDADYGVLTGFALELGALLGLDAGVHLALGAIGSEDGAHHEPEDQADADRRRDREDHVSPHGCWHTPSLTAAA
ncbi:MAG: pirin-like C-terminal cupin domain-containing protein [Galbitalea sp.]